MLSWVRRDRQVRNVRCRIARFGKIDILLNNAGVAVPNTVEQLTTDEWDKEMNTNVRGAYLDATIVVPHMRERRYGKIVNISSVNALIADKSPLLARHVYNASKAAVLGLTIGMAASYGVDGITVNAVCPGLFESEMMPNTLFKTRGVHEDVQFHRSDEPSRSPGRTERYDPLLPSTLRGFMSPVSTWSSMAVPSSDGRAADEGRSVLWRADFRHDHINGGSVSRGVKMGFTDVALRVTRNTYGFRQGCFSFSHRSGRVRPAVVTSANLCLFREVRLSRYCTRR